MYFYNLVYIYYAVVNRCNLKTVNQSFWLLSFYYLIVKIFLRRVTNTHLNFFITSFHTCLLLQCFINNLLICSNLWPFACKADVTKPIAFAVIDLSKKILPWQENKMSFNCKVYKSEAFIWGICVFLK